MAKQEEPNLWKDSRFESLEQYIHDTLDESGRLRLKFLSPLGVGIHLVKCYLEVVASRLDLLQTDFAMLSDVDAQLELFKEDMQRDFAFRMSDIENVLFEVEKRGDVYFDETFRLARVLDLMSKGRIEKEFGPRVVGAAPQRIEQKVDELIDWLVDANLCQWLAVTEHLAERRRIHQDRIVGDADTDGFHQGRERLMESVGREAQRVVESYDKTREAEAIAEGAQLAVAASAAMEVGAIGLGTLIATLATTLAADVTGVLLASLVAVLGLFVIPARRRRTRAEMSAKIAALREQLVNSLQSQFEREIERSLHRFDEAIAPYTRFVRAERGKLLDTQTELQEIKNKLDHLKVQVEEM